MMHDILIFLLTRFHAPPSIVRMRCFFIVLFLAFPVSAIAQTWQNIATSGTLTSGDFCTTDGNTINCTTGFTGTGNAVLASSPTLTGTVTGAASNWSGNVGIGTTSPGALLHLASSNTGYGGGIFFQNTTSAQSFSMSSRSDGTSGARFDISDETSHTPRFDILSSGYIGINISNPIVQLDVIGPNGSVNNNEASTTNTLDLSTGHNTDDQMMYFGNDKTNHWSYIESDRYNCCTTPILLNSRGGNIGIGLSSNPAYTLQVNGSVAGTSNYNNTSDVRLKKDVAPIAYGLDTVMKLRPIGFNWINQDQEWKKQHQLGLIAQEVEPFIPEVVTIAKDEMKTRSLAYSELVPVLIKSIQELKAANDNEQALVQTLKAANENQQHEIQSLKEDIESLRTGLKGN